MKIALKTIMKGSKWECLSECTDVRTVFVSVCRLRSGKGLYNARLHVEAGKSVLDPVAASLLLSFPQPCGVEGGGRVTGEFTSQHRHSITVHVHVCLS